MLTNASVKAARPRTRAYKIADGQGLYPHVAPTGRYSKSWRMRYRDPGGREKTLTFGLHAIVQVADAQDQRDRARELLERGEDPRAPAAVPDRTFEQAARAWLEHRAPGWSPVHVDDL